MYPKPHEREGADSLLLPVIWIPDQACTLYRSGNGELIRQGVYNNLSINIIRNAIISPF
jgi:hypothetical protein